MLTFALSYSRRADDEAAVGYRLSDTREFSRRCENGGCVYGRSRFLKRNEVVVYQPQVGKAEVVHGSSDRAYVVRIARPHQDDRNPFALGITEHVQALKLWPLRSGPKPKIRKRTKITHISKIVRAH
jgi:hypothetical protein